MEAEQQAVKAAGCVACVSPRRGQHAAHALVASMCRFPEAPTAAAKVGERRQVRGQPQARLVVLATVEQREHAARRWRRKRCAAASAAENERLLVLRVAISVRANLVTTVASVSMDAQC